MNTIFKKTFGLSLIAMVMATGFAVAAKPVKARKGTPHPRAAVIKAQKRAPRVVACARCYRGK